MNIFKRRKKIENISVDNVINFIEKHQKSLSKKCEEAYNDGNVQSGRWWDCQACAMIDLINEFKKAYFYEIIGGNAMTIKELKEKLNKFSDDFIVMIPNQDLHYVSPADVYRGCNEADRCVFIDNYEEED